MFNITTRWIANAPQILWRCFPCRHLTHENIYNAGVEMEAYTSHSSLHIITPDHSYTHHTRHPAHRSLLHIITLTVHQTTHLTHVCTSWFESSQELEIVMGDAHVSFITTKIGSLLDCKKSKWVCVLCCCDCLINNYMNSITGERTHGRPNCTWSV